VDHFLEFHWWYLIVGAAVFLVFGRGKGGIVVTKLTASMRVLDSRFEQCRPEATYATFKEGTPDHINVEIENLSLRAGEELTLHLNGACLAQVKVKPNLEVEFDHWSDEDVDFPRVEKGDELVVRYEDLDVLKGTFH
jgi:hypothetical protein